LLLLFSSAHTQGDLDIVIQTHGLLDVEVLAKKDNLPSFSERDELFLHSSIADYIWLIAEVAATSSSTIILML
jgi:hypothetical protein